MSLELYQYTLSAALICLVIEMLSGTILFLGFFCGLLALAVVHYFSPEFIWARDLFILSVVSGASFVGLRRLLKKRSDLSTEQSDVNQY